MWTEDLPLKPHDNVLAWAAKGKQSEKGIWQPGYFSARVIQVWDTDVQVHYMGYKDSSAKISKSLIKATTKEKWQSGLKGQPLAFCESKIQIMANARKGQYLCSV